MLLQPLFSNNNAYFFRHQCIYYQYLIEPLSILTFLLLLSMYIPFAATLSNELFNSTLSNDPFDATISV